MELDFTFRNVESTEAIKAWALKRFQKVVKHVREPAHAHLTLIVDKHRHRAECTIRTDGEFLKASGETDDMYASIDSVCSTIENAARRLKDRHRSSHEL
jgi:putative sigma-54 modulation protein